MKKELVVIGVCLLCTLSVFSGCVNVPEELTQFSIVSFDIEPGVINPGEFANLSWVVLSASSINIDNGIGNVALTGHRIIQPMQTTTYILTASNATLTKSATATITVKPAPQTPQNNQIITDGINDVSSVDYFTQETTIVSSHPEIAVNNLDIVKATYKQQGTQATITLQVRGSIENRGKIIDYYTDDTSGPLNFVEYDFSLSTTEQDYTISYSNHAGQVSNGVDTTNLTSSDFTVVGDTLTVTFDITSAAEVYDGMSVTSMFVKMNISAGDMDISGYVYLSDIAPNPALEIMEVYAPNIGLVGESIQFNGSIIPLTGQPPYQYRWDFGDEKTSTQMNPTHVYTTAGVYIYTFTVTDQAGDTNSETGTITINQPMQYTPNIACTTDSTTNRIFVAVADANIRWDDITITTNPVNNWALWTGGGITNEGVNTYPNNAAVKVIAGDYLFLYGTSVGNVRVTLRYEPTNSLLGTWTVNV
jgi:hypothetical protein